METRPVMPVRVASSPVSIYCTKQFGQCCGEPNPVPAPLPDSPDTDPCQNRVFLGSTGRPRERAECGLTSECRSENFCSDWGGLELKEKIVFRKWERQKVMGTGNIWHPRQPDGHRLCSQEIEVQVAGRPVWQKAGPAMKE